MNRDSAETVLVLDGESRAALAVVRSLGRKGKRVVVASVDKKGLAGHSRFASLHIACPSADLDPNAFCTWLTQSIQEERISHLIPITDTSLRLALSIEERIREYAVLPTVSRDVFEAVSNKDRLLETASELGVPCPRSISVLQGAGQDDTQRQAIQTFSYPAVAKPVQSSEHQDEKIIQAEVRYFDSAEDALLFFSRQETQKGVRYLLQERVRGCGVGVFALCVDGQAVTVFSHRRILEKPPSGGRSVLSQSLLIDDAPVEQALRLLEHYRWNGVAMVEFKQNLDGTFYLMEINPRFWGSLQLAVDSGRDFPCALLELFPSGEQADALKIASFRESQSDFAPGCRLRWSLGCLDHFLIRMKANPLSALRETIFGNALQFFTRRCDKSGVAIRCRLEVLRMEDPRPFVIELRHYVLSLLRIV